MKKNQNNIFKTFPSSGSARAAARALAPVKTPTSMTFLAPRLLISTALRLVTSGAPIMAL